MPGLGHGLSGVPAILSGVVRYDIEALLSRFDVRVEGATALTGKLSSLLGESFLLSALVRYLSADEGRQVEVLGDRPHRDDNGLLFPVEGRKAGGFRDLDAWLLLDGGQLAAVECKHWTSSSTNYRSIPEDDGALTAHARREWALLVGGHFGQEFFEHRWTNVNKVALPLKPPTSLPSANMAGVRRILAIWTPVSEDGQSCMSSVNTTSIWGEGPISVDVDVFSASMYLRELRRAGVTHLEAEDAELERLLAALSALVEVTGLSAAG